MTPHLLLAILAALALALMALLLAIFRRARLRKPKARLVPAPERAADVADPPSIGTTPAQPAPEQPPRPLSRMRRIGPEVAVRETASLAPAEGEAGHYAACLARLEQAFDLYTQGRISLETYETMVRAEREAIRRERAELRSRELSGEDDAVALDQLREQIESTEVAVQWCLDWSDGLRREAAVDRGNVNL